MTYNLKFEMDGVGRFHLIERRSQNVNYNHLALGFGFEQDWCLIR